MVSDDNYTHGEHNMVYRAVESLCYICEINLTLCVNYTQILKKGEAEENLK